MRSSRPCPGTGGAGTQAREKTAAPTIPTSPLSAVSQPGTPIRTERWWAMMWRRTRHIFRTSTATPWSCPPCCAASTAWDPMEPGVILDHAGGHALGIASNHSDVGQWWPLHGKTMDDFRRAVRDAMRGGEETVTQEQFDAMMADYLARRGREKPSDWSENARPLGGGGRTGLRGQRWDALSGLHHPGGDHPVPLPLPAGDGREAITEKEPPPPEEPAEGASGHGVAQALQSP